MISKKQKEKLLKSYKNLYTGWEMDGSRMKKVESRALKGLVRCLIAEVCQEIEKNNKKKNKKTN